VKRLMVWGLGQQLEFGNIAQSIQGNGRIGVAKIDGFEGFVDGSGCKLPFCNTSLCKHRRSLLGRIFGN